MQVKVSTMEKKETIYYIPLIISLSSYVSMVTPNFPKVHTHTIYSLNVSHGSTTICVPPASFRNFLIKQFQRCHDIFFASAFKPYMSQKLGPLHPYIYLNIINKIIDKICYIIDTISQMKKCETANPNKCALQLYCIVFAMRRFFFFTFFFISYNSLPPPSPLLRLC